MSNYLRHRRGRDHSGELDEPLIQEASRNSQDNEAYEYSRLHPPPNSEDGDSSPLVERKSTLQVILQALVQLWAHFWALLWCKPADPPPLELTFEQEVRLEKLRGRRSVPFDITIQEHEDSLRRLWSMAFPNKALSGLKSEQWKEMGWQGNDPSTDFRGAGYMALENLLYLGDKHPSLFKDLLDKVNGQRSAWEYPFCVAGVNLTFTLLQILDVKQDGSLPSTQAGGNFFTVLTEDSDSAFEEIYCIAFEALDEKWLEMKASYMDFPAVMKAVKEKLEAAVEEANSIEGVRGLMKMA